MANNPSKPLAVGMKAPDFSALDQSGKSHALSQYRGQYVLLYFYPRDNTPGCTLEACNFRDNYQTISKKIQILGVSTDTLSSHQRFAQKYNLPFPLLVDDAKSIVKAYGVYAPKKFMGREFLGTLRTSFLINPDGIIEKIYHQVKAATHVQDILSDLLSLKPLNP